MLAHAQEYVLLHKAVKLKYVQVLDGEQYHFLGENLLFAYNLL